MSCPCHCCLAQAQPAPGGVGAGVGVGTVGTRAVVQPVRVRARGNRGQSLLGHVEVRLVQRALLADLGHVAHDAEDARAAHAIAVEAGLADVAAGRRADDLLRAQLLRRRALAAPPSHRGRGVSGALGADVLHVREADVRALLQRRGRLVVPRDAGGAGRVVDRDQPLPLYHRERLVAADAEPVVLDLRVERVHVDVEHCTPVHSRRWRRRRR